MTMYVGMDTSSILAPRPHPGAFIQALGVGLRCATDQSTEMDAFLTISAQRADSAFIIAANSSGLLPIGSAASASSRSRTTPVVMVSTVAFRILSAMAFGVPFGTTNPYQAVAS